MALLNVTVGEAIAIKPRSTPTAVVNEDYDPRIGRFLRVDPLTSKFPWQSPVICSMCK
jgi:hypothetical protein